ncbi:MAG: sigma-54 dependent transcriptional regulator [Gemmatimonadota bacterium]|nr:sigma-54 dependent transcriptional regulator [Gemmatimonadota bacterium]
MSTDRVLVSTHDLPMAGELREGFEGEGYEVELVTPTEKLDVEKAALLVLTGGAEEGGGELAGQVRAGSHVPVLAVAEGSQLQPALRPGFDEVFPRSTPIADIVLVGRGFVERRRLRRVTGIIGETDEMHQVLERVVQIAPVESTVLVTGESGTGKELVARGIHGLSSRRHKAFIAVNVAALSDTLLESELFGHEKGAFTGAIDSRRGLFELASGGTIFLDEIGEMPLATQTKLLRVLEQREFHRVGGERTVKVDVRIVAATNQDLRQLVAIGEFRRDLFFRLNVLSIELPPLRERREDIPLLVEVFVREISEAHDLDFPGISAEAMEVLRNYAWPGNVRELRNLVESMVVLAPGRVIRPEDIPDEVRGGRGASLLPARITRPGGRGESGEGEAREKGDIRPELEFVFRTLVELRVDIDDLRRDFEQYRREQPSLGPAGEAVLGRLGAGAGRSAGDDTFSGEVEIAPYRPGNPPEEEERPEAHEPLPLPDDDFGEEPGQWDESEGSAVVFRPGMTIEDMERRAIEVALAEVGGNRRRAAELLGIGERTLYRKISKYDLEEE